MEPHPQRWEATVLPLYHRGPSLNYDKSYSSYIASDSNNMNSNNLAAYCSYDSQCLYSRQEQSFSCNDSFKFYNYISDLQQFSYEHDIMNNTNVFTLSLVNETSWDLNESIVINETNSNEVKVPLLNTKNYSSMIVTRGNDIDKVVHRSYRFIPLSVPKYYCTDEGGQSEFEPTK